MNYADLAPEYNLTQHQIDTVNYGDFHTLGDELLRENGNDTFVTQADAEDQDQQELVMGILMHASYYAYGVKARVEEMYGEAYAANEYQTGPDQYFEDQKHPVRARVSRFLGSFTLGR